ncbi:MAG: hypothetical protein ABI469_04235 [Gemmatimonadales bacterium]
MSLASRLSSTAVFVLAPLSYANAQTAGKTLAMDFRTTVSVQGAPDTSVMLGHAVGSPDKMRLDVKGTGTPLSPLASDSLVSMIVTDSGKTITYIDAKKSQYLRVRPAELVTQAQQMGGMRMDFSGTEAKVDNLGAGPVILGHHTAHYRLATGMTMKISAVGRTQQTVRIASTTDTYYATDISGVLNPFASMSGSDMANMFGTANSEFANKLKAAQAKLPKGTPLRTSSSATIFSDAGTRVTNSAAEVTAIKWVDADPKAFEIPANYTAVPLPGMPGSAPATVPPK